MKKTVCILSVLLCACSGENENKKNNSYQKIEEKVFLPESPANELLKEISSPLQKFSVALTRDTSLICLNGTKLSFAQNCFVNENGETVNDVIIEVAEATSIADFLQYNLQTESDGKLLETAGMIYVNAKDANGNNLRIQEGKDLFIELPAGKSTNPEFSIFTGKFDESGNINWEEKESLEEQMIPLPLKELELKYHTQYKIDKNGEYIILDSVHINESEYENTFIATIEFKKRFYAMCPTCEFWSDYYDEYLTSGTNDYYWYFNEPTGRVINLNCIPINIYLENTDKPLWYADSLVILSIENKFRKDSITFVTNHKGKKWLGGPWGWEFAFGWSYPEWYKRQWGGRPTQPHKFDPRGVDCSLANAKELLMKKGCSEMEARQQIRIHQAREKFIKDKREAKEREKEAAEIAEMTKAAFSTAFGTTELGWINVDRFYNDPSAKEAELIVELKNADSLKIADITLLIPSRNIAINGHEDEKVKGKYRFTKKEEMYRKLPVGEEAIIVAISVHNKIPFFSAQRIKIEARQLVTMSPSKSDWAKIKDELKKI